MICKKCGSTIDDNSKFCGYCGEKVEQEVSIDPNVIESNVNIVPDTIANVGGVSQEINNDPAISSLNLASEQTSNLVSNQDVTQVLPPMPDQVQMNQNNQIPDNKKGSKKGIFITLAVILAVALVGVAIYFAITGLNKSSSDPLAVLQKALGNFDEKASDSLTMNAKVSIETTTNDSMNLSATMKYAKKGDSYDISVKLNKSLINDEMSLYTRVNNENLTLYAESALIDLLGLTYSEENLWVNYSLNLEDILEDIEFTNTDSEFNISDILDKEHFKYVDSSNGVNRYQIILDEKLFDNNGILNEDEMMELEELFDSEYINNFAIYLYINNSNELVKISMEVTGLEEEGISKIVASLEFSNLNSTVVTIPSDAINNSMNLEDYMEEYEMSYDYDDDYDYDFDFNYDDDYDFDWDF